MPELLIKSGKHQGKRLVLPQSEVILGRDASCQIRIGSEDVSRHHCQLTVTARGMRAKDLGSQNGTFVNDVLLTGEKLLDPGDEIRIGPMIFQIPVKKKIVKQAHIQTRPQNSKAGAGASDADILDWLSPGDEISGEIPVEETATGDTTVIPKSALASQKPVSAPSYQQQTTAEEAAEIIRKHWEMVRQKKNEGET